MADGIIFKNTLVRATVIKNNEAYTLNLPFRIYGFDVLFNNKIITYDLDKFVGQAVVAKVDYSVADEAIVKAFSGELGTDPTVAQVTPFCVWQDYKTNGETKDVSPADVLQVK